MTLKNKILLSLFIFLFYSCSASTVNSKIINPPTKSFVQVFHTADIISCTKADDPKCPIGMFRSTGSGMAIDVIPKTMTVITAGHVCDSRPTDKIDKIIQTIEVLDHEKNIHQAWPIMITHTDNKESSDLCLLWVPTLKVKKIKFSTLQPRIGQELYYIGAPVGIYHPPTVPIIRGTFSGDVDLNSSMITAPAIGGSSGSAVLNFDNRIVGIIWGSNLSFHHVSLMTKHKVFKTFLENARDRYK